MRRPCPRVQNNKQWTALDYLELTDEHWATAVVVGAKSGEADLTLWGPCGTGYWIGEQAILVSCPKATVSLVHTTRTVTSTHS